MCAAARHPRRRIQVVGVSGAGKTRLSRQLAEMMGIEPVELDSMFHQPGWMPLPAEDFLKKVETVVTAEHWVIDGNYQSYVGNFIRGYADTLVWIDLPRWRAMTQVAARSLRRVFTREELWNGNREEWRDLFSRDPEENIVLWTWTQYDKYRLQYGTVASDPANAHIEFIRLQTRRDLRRFVESFGRETDR